MNFGYFSIDEAKGALLAHSMRVGKQVIKKGTCLGIKEIAQLDAAGIRQVAAVRIEAGDIDEQNAAHATKDRGLPRKVATVALAEQKDKSYVRVAAVVLAAGSSRRMGGENKLLAEISGKSVIAHVVETALASHAGEIIVVTGHQADRIRAELKGYDVRFAHNPYYPEGLSRSLHAGLGAASAKASGAIFCLGDMPLITPHIIDLLIAEFQDHGAEKICVPVIDGRRGNPVLWPRAFFSEILDLSGDAGARQLFNQYADRIREIEIDMECIFADVDTPETLLTIRDQLESQI